MCDDYGELSDAVSDLHDQIEELRSENARLKDLLKFVATDPCFVQLGTVTQDEVRAGIGP